jgi:hypothetical protein
MLQRIAQTSQNDRIHQAAKNQDARRLARSRRVQDDRRADQVQGSTDSHVSAGRGPVGRFHQQRIIGRNGAFNVRRQIHSLTRRAIETTPIHELSLSVIQQDQLHIEVGDIVGLEIHL